MERARNAKRTGIGSLKIRFNQIFGYYIEISRPNLPNAPADYERKQTLVNAERFTSPELKRLRGVKSSPPTSVSSKSNASSSIDLRSGIAAKSLPPPPHRRRHRQARRPSLRSQKNRRRIALTSAPSFNNARVNSSSSVAATPSSKNCSARKGERFVPQRSLVSNQGPPATPFNHRPQHGAANPLISARPRSSSSWPRWGSFVPAHSGENFPSPTASSPRIGAQR